MRLTLNVIVGTKDIDDLQAGGFNLCLTKDVRYRGQDINGNVVFSMITAKNLGPRMTLEWDEKYQTFGTREFQAGAKVTVSTDIANIEIGQIAIIEPDGSIRISASTESIPAFSVDNQWKQPAAIGVNNFDAASGKYATIFISPLVPRPSMSDLLPIQKYSVFWDMNLVTDTMFQHTATPPFSFDLTNSNQITLKYENGVWSTP